MWRTCDDDNSREVGGGDEGEVLVGGGIDEEGILIGFLRKFVGFSRNLKFVINYCKADAYWKNHGFILYKLLLFFSLKEENALSDHSPCIDDCMTWIGFSLFSW